MNKNIFFTIILFFNIFFFLLLILKFGKKGNWDNSQIKWYGKMRYCAIIYNLKKGNCS